MSSATTSKATAAGAPVSLKLAGKEYRMRPLTLEDHAEFDRWLQQRVIRMAREMITPDMSRDDQEAVMDAAFRRAERTGLETHEGLQVANSLNGVSRLLWMGLRHHHPDLTPEAVKALLVDKQTIADAMDAFDLANDRRGSSKKKGAKKTAKKRTARKKKSR